MRRAANESSGAAGETCRKDAAKIKFGSWILDRTQYQVFDLDNNPLDLTIGEFKLLEALLMSANRTLSREHLFEATREGEYDAYDRAIDIQIARIRKKLNDDAAMIKTVRGVGYMFAGQTELIP
jgi:two-component system phosphate regulon response regulator OmpR